MRCTECKKEIDSSATKCPYCHSTWHGASIGGHDLVSTIDMLLWLLTTPKGLFLSTIPILIGLTLEDEIVSTILFLGGLIYAPFGFTNSKNKN
jgi:hypothetical protein